MGSRKMLLVATALVSAPLAAQDNPSKLTAELSARYAQMKAAMANKDELAIRSLLAPGFVSVDVDGKSENVADMIKEVAALPADPSRRSRTTIMSVSRVGETAVVEQRYEMTKTAKAPDGTPKSVTLKTVSRDNWINDKRVWRIAKTVTEQLDYSVDGATVLHKVNRTTE